MTAHPKFMIALPARAHDHLKDLAKAHRCRPGVMVQALLSLADEIPTDTIKAAVDRAKASRSGWVADRVHELREHFTRLRDLAREAGDENTARQAEARIKELSE